MTNGTCCEAKRFKSCCNLFTGLIWQRGTFSSAVELDERPAESGDAVPHIGT